MPAKEMKPYPANLGSRPARSNDEGRVGQVWAENEIYIFDNEKYAIVKRSTGHFQCHCRAVVRLDEHGNAACEACGEIYNDGIKVESVKVKSKITTRSFIYKAFNKVD